VHIILIFGPEFFFLMKPDTIISHISPSEGSLDNIIEEGFRFQTRSKAYRQQVMTRKIKQKAMDGNTIQILKRDGSNFLNQPCHEGDEEDGKEIEIDPALISIVIGTRGRNISLIGKTTSVFLRIVSNTQVVLVTKNSKSDVDLAHRMMISMMSGGVIRWFSHPDATNKFYHPSVRGDLENLVSATSDCTLELLRAHNGHLCLLLIPTKEANKQIVGDQIQNLRPILLEKLVAFAQKPSHCDSSRSTAHSEV
jgi:hypothetical protein